MDAIQALSVVNAITGKNVAPPTPIEHSVADVFDATSVKMRTKAVKRLSSITGLSDEDKDWAKYGRRGKPKK